MQNFVKKWKCLNLGPKMPHLTIFGLEFLRTFVLFEISKLEFVKHESLTHAMNFDIGSTFFKGLGLLFLKIRVRVLVRVHFIKYAFKKKIIRIFTSRILRKVTLRWSSNFTYRITRIQMKRQSENNQGEQMKNR